MESTTTREKTSYKQLEDAFCIPDPEDGLFKVIEELTLWFSAYVATPEFQMRTTDADKACEFWQFSVLCEYFRTLDLQMGTERRKSLIAEMRILALRHLISEEEKQRFQEISATLDRDLQTKSWAVSPEFVLDCFNCLHGDATPLAKHLRKWHKAWLKNNTMSALEMQNSTYRLGLIINHF